MQRAAPVSIGKSEERRSHAQRDASSSDENSNSNSGQSATATGQVGGGERGGPISAATSVSTSVSTLMSTPPNFGVVGGRGKGKRDLDGMVKEVQAWQRPEVTSRAETGSWTGISHAQTETGMEKDVWNPTKYATPKYGVNPFHHGLYSRASGIDVVGILVKVATRKSPQIDLGVIDLSCALVICAADVDDEPVIYVSEGFEMLTGYKSQEIVGRNCRFLQRPPTPPSLSQSHDPRPKATPNVNANLSPGEKEILRDDASVEGQGRGDGNTRKRLRLDVEERRETQVQVLNYKKGGEAFVNILSIVPIGEAQGGVKYLVGFMAEAKRWHS